MCVAAGDFERAASYFRVLSMIAPHDASAHSDLGSALGKLRQFDHAATAFRQAVALAPDSADFHANLASALADSETVDESEHHARRALALEPKHAVAHATLARVLKQIGRIDEALGHYPQAVALQPENADIKTGFATALLLKGDYEAGWRAYEARWKTGKIPERSFKQPAWHGKARDATTILLHAEQGLGDTLQFVRYAPLVKERGGTVVLECQKPLIDVLARCPGIDRLVPCGHDLPPFDLQAPLLSLPRIFGTTLASIPSRVPYVSADPGLVEFWRGRLAAIRESLRQPARQTLHGVRDLLIGINWSGRSTPGPHQQRDIPLEHFTGLAALPGVKLISLRKGRVHEAERNAPGLQPNTETVRFAHPSIVDFGEELDTAHGAFMDTAAIMMNLDLVITSDTSVAHLAGALGVPVWVALPFVPDWRWLLDRSDSPWYPTMRLFRQKSRGDWAGVFKEIEAALRERLRKNRE